MSIVVIGGGAAGFFAAIHAAKYAPVILLEKSKKLLTKVKVSGGGRCNVTNSCADPALLVTNYPRGGKELRGPFSKFHTLHTCEWFENRGVALKFEADGRVFPKSDSSQTIIDCLLAAASDSGVDIRTGVSVSGIAWKNEQVIIETTSGELVADKVIVASGGFSSQEQYHWLEKTGHTIITPVPSLFTFNMPGSRFLELMGVSVDDVKIKINGSNFSEQGPLLFTHWGISGPAVLKLSAWAARWLHNNNYQFSVNLNFVPSLNQTGIREVFSEHIKLNPGKLIVYSKPLVLPSRLWEKLCFISDVDESKRWRELSKSHLNKLSENILNLTLQVKGKTTFKEEFVTCGGVDLKEVKMQTMESKLVKGLYFAGEVLNIDGITGGFNFQAAWTTGFLAGTSAGMN